MLYTPLNFTFKNTCSLDVKNIRVLDSFPLPETPSRRVVKSMIAGRSGDLRIIEHDDSGQDVYDSIDKPVILCYTGNDYDLIKRWLRGDGNLILSNQADRYYKASVDNVVSIVKLSKIMKTFTVVFTCFPYAFLNVGLIPIVYNPTPNITTWETIIMNENDLSLPHLKIYGQGDIGLLINNIETDFYSDLQQCYKDNINLGMNMSGNFPILYSGKNVIEFTGNIKQVILTPNWRAL